MSSIHHKNTNSSDMNSVYSSTNNGNNSNHFKPLSFNYNNINIPITLEEINMFEGNCINIAALFNYDNEKSETAFTTIVLPEISISFHSLVKLFFCHSGKSFNPFVLNKIWSSIKGLKLANFFIRTYEEKNNINQHFIPALTKIRLHKECSFDKITNKMKKIIALNLNELVNAFDTVEPRPDGKIYTSICFYLFSEALQVGLNVTLPVAVSNIYDDNYIEDDQSLCFDFEDNLSEHNSQDNHHNNHHTHK
jgi:hypothetical protein